MADVLGRRIVAAIIDVGVVLVLLGVVAGLFGNDTAAGASIAEKMRGSPTALLLALILAYFAGSETIWAQTLGKRVMKLRVVGSGGGKAGAGPIVVRNVVRFVDWLPGFYIVGAITLFATGDRRVRLGDIAAKTMVVGDEGTPPQQPPPPERPDDEDVLAQIMR
jgi:uncharacterized RDD family membrane protein YckC